MESQETNKKTVVIVLILVLAVLLATGSFRYFSVLRQESQRQAAADERVKATDDAFKASHLHNSPTALRDLFLDDVRNGVNDKVTKSAIYFITHRFFDNGGNIYEIYDFIENNPELAFMKEAEAIYPGIFDQIKKKQVPPTQVDRASYAYLAYIETLYRHGYADIAAKATAANLYAKTAYYNTEIAKEMPKEEGKQRAKNAKRDIAKAIKIMEVSKDDVAMILDGKLTEEDITPRDILVGLNQYGAALRYLEAYGANFSSPKKAKEIFTYTMEYSRRKVPELMFFTSLLNASTLALLEVAQPVDIRTALYPILEVDAKGPLLETSIIHKILNSRHEQPPKNIGETLMSIYSKRNTLRLADKVPEFRAWLMSNGWTEEDFR